MRSGREHLASMVAVEEDEEDEEEKEKSYLIGKTIYIGREGIEG